MGIKQLPDGRYAAFALLAASNQQLGPVRCMRTLVKPGNRSQVTRADRKFQFVVENIFALKLTVFSFKSFSLRQFQFTVGCGG